MSLNFTVWPESTISSRINSTSLSSTFGIFSFLLIEILDVVADAAAFGAAFLETKLAEFGLRPDELGLDATTVEVVGLESAEVVGFGLGLSTLSAWLGLDVERVCGCGLAEAPVWFRERIRSTRVRSIFFFSDSSRGEEALPFDLKVLNKEKQEISLVDLSLG
jgi:hypothetical protein